MRRTEWARLHRALRVAVIPAVLVVAACGSQNEATDQDGSADNGSPSEGGPRTSDDAGSAHDTGTGDRTIEDSAVDAASLPDAAKSGDDGGPNGDARPPGDAALNGEAGQSGDAGANADAAPNRDAGPSGDSGSARDAGGSDGGSTGEAAATFHGLNWADARDNFVNGLLQLSGLDTSSDTYSTVQAKATQILAQFRTKIGANAIRIPINEPTVSGAWWNAYKAVIDTATASGMKVIVAYWAYHNGKPDDETAFKNMWQTVVSEYMANDLVYFDIHNEPYGFGSSWNNEAAMWLGYFPSLPKGRIVVGGTGYDDNVTSVGADTRFAGCLLELHLYGFQHKSWTTRTQWIDALNSDLGSYGARTIVGEWGDVMNDGSNYDVDAGDGSNQLSYVTTMSDFLHGAGMGSCYWPGLRDGDSYSMTTLATAGTTLTLSIVNTSGLDRLHWAWNLP